MTDSVKTLVDKDYISKDWAEKFPDLFAKFRTKIVPELAKQTQTVYPLNSKDIFKAFKECPVDTVRVVILLQDPYHDGSATGLALDNVKTKKKVSPSLVNVLKEIRDDLGQTKADINNTSYLEHLPSQGVLLINSALTVVKGQPLSHIELWKDWTEDLVSDLNKLDNIVWVLWGNFAKGFKSKITNTTHKVVEGAHPSPFSATKFFGGKYFSAVNNILKDNIIVW